MTFLLQKVPTVTPKQAAASWDAAPTRKSTALAGRTPTTSGNPSP